MFDCRKFWGLATFRFVRSTSGIVFLSLLVLSVSSSIAQEPEGEVSATPETATQPETSPVADEAETSSIEPEPEETSIDPSERYGANVIRDVNAIRDGVEPSNAGQGGLNEDMLGEGARTLQSAILRMIGGLSVVLALILLSYYGFRRFGKKIPALAGRQLGQVIGQVHLTRDATLFYVRTGGRVLVVSVASGDVNAIAEFDEGAFDSDLGKPMAPGGFEPEHFVEQLREQSEAYSTRSAGDSNRGDDDMASLRSDIHRLQEYLQEEARDSKD